MDTLQREWVTQAGCAGTDPEAFFPVAKGGSYPRQVYATCRACPVRLPCGLEQVARDPFDLHGLWAGLTPNQFRDVQRAITARVKAFPGVDVGEVTEDILTAEFDRVDSEQYKTRQLIEWKHTE